jgi:hypothetical protein
VTWKTAAYLNEAVVERLAPHKATSEAETSEARAQTQILQPVPHLDGSELVQEDVVLHERELPLERPPEHVPRLEGVLLLEEGQRVAFLRIERLGQLLGGPLSNGALLEGLGEVGHGDVAVRRVPAPVLLQAGVSDVWAFAKVASRQNELVNSHPRVIAKGFVFVN